MDDRKEHKEIKGFLTMESLGLISVLFVVKK